MRVKGDPAAGVNHKLVGADRRLQRQSGHVFLASAFRVAIGNNRTCRCGPRTIQRTIGEIAPSAERYLAHSLPLFDDAHRRHNRIGCCGCAGKIANQVQRRGLKRARHVNQDTVGRADRGPQLAVIIDTLEPEIAHFVGDHIADVHEIKQRRRGDALQLFTDAAIGHKLGGRDEQRHELVIALQRQHAAVEAVHSGDTPEQRQIGRQNFASFEGDDQF